MGFCTLGSDAGEGAVNTVGASGRNRRRVGVGHDLPHHAGSGIEAVKGVEDDVKLAVELHVLAT